MEPSSVDNIAFLSPPLITHLTEGEIHAPAFSRQASTNSSVERKMETQNREQAKQPSAAVSSCRKKKSEDASFLQDVKDHIDEFINASMDEHKSCFKKTMQKMFGMSKIVAERSAETKEVESSLPLQTVVE